MKKVLLLLFFAAPVFGNGPKYVGPQKSSGTVNWANVYQEFVNVYHDIQFVSPSTATIQAETVTVSTITNLAVGGNLNANNFKVTNLANGTAATDAVALGQITGKRVLQVVQFIYTSNTTTTSASYVVTPLAVTITPASLSSTILIFFSTQAIVGAATTLALTLKRGTTDLMPNANGLCNGVVNSATCSMAVWDGPNTISATTYAIYIKLAGGASGSGIGQNNSNSVIIAVEIG